MAKEKGFMPIIIIIVAAIAVLGAGGYFGYKYYNEKISNSLVPISSEDQNAGWETYTNAQYGFQIQYLANTQIKNMGKNISFIFADKKRQLDVEVITGAKPNECYVTAWAADVPDISLNGITFKGVGCGLKCEPYDRIQYCTINDGTAYKLLPRIVYIATEHNFVEKDATLNQMLSTFKFITATDQTAGWKTYTNSEYGFEIKYPADNWRLFVEAPRGSSLHLMQIGAIDEFGSVQLYIQSGNVDSWLSNKATHTRETVYINGLQAEKFYFGRDLKTDASFTYVFERNNLVYVINTSLMIGNKYGISETDISQILSTFKFTSQTKQSACAPLDSIASSDKTKDAVSCFLNNEKSVFKSGLDLSDVLSGTCIISEIRDRYVDNKFGQIVNPPCSNCRLQGAEVWFRCTGYSSQFGCYFVINQDKSFGEIYCPSGV